MPRNGSGSFSIINTFIPNTTILSSQVNANFTDIATGLSNSIATDGQTATVNEIPFNDGISTDTIAENTTGLGVTIDGVLLKDGRVDWSKATDIASATTPDITEIAGNYVVITGTTQIDGFAVANAGVTRWLRFADILQLTNSGTLILPGGANITTAAGDIIQAVSDGSGTWRVIYFPIAGTASQGAVNKFTKTQIWSKGADIVSAATLVLGSDGNYFDVTGNTGPITAITVASGTLFMLQFDSTPTLTYDATALNLPGGTNIVVQAGDRLIGFATAANQVEVVDYIRASGRAITSISSSIVQSTTSGTSVLFTGFPAGVTRICILFSAVSLSGTDSMLIQMGTTSGIETTGYTSTSVAAVDGNSSSAVSSNSGFIVRGGNSAAAFRGQMTIERLNGNTWVESHSGSATNLICNNGGGDKTLSAEVTQINIISNGSNTFDGGSVNILVE